jgi:CheY-like chemotaxis protein
MFVLEAHIMSPAFCEVDLDVIPETARSPGDLTKVLVVDDSKFDRHLVGQLLKSMNGIRVLFATDGREALEIIDRESPSIVLTDLVMPEMDGLGLVQQVRALHPQISVILMTAHGSEEVAMQALRAGAANYIPKQHLVRDLDHTLRKVLAIAAQWRERRLVLKCLVRRETTLVLDNDPEVIIPIVTMLNEELEGIGSWDPTSLMQMCVALHEALTNALFHGNLEVGSHLRHEDECVFYAETSRRRNQEPYRSRRVRLHAQVDRAAARFLIADDGPGYAEAAMDRPVQPDDLNCVGGRGLLLIRTFMDQVSLNKAGNQIAMVKNGSIA